MTRVEAAAWFQKALKVRHSPDVKEAMTFALSELSLPERQPTFSGTIAPAPLSTVLKNDTNPGHLLLAAFLFQNEARKERLLLNLYEKVTRWSLYSYSPEIHKPGAHTYLFRDVLDKARYHGLKGLEATFLRLFQSAKVYDLRLFENAAARASERCVYACDLQDSSVEERLHKLPEVEADYDYIGGKGSYYWWRETADRYVRERL